MDEYYQDASGQWWCRLAKRGTRARVSPQTCEQCNKEFVNRHPQRFCSTACRGVAHRGTRKPLATCPICGTEFNQRSRRKARETCSPECSWRLRSQRTKGKWAGERNPRWNGGKKHMATGYVLVYVPGRQHMLEHRYVMEQILGRPLERFEQVHHLNGKRDDNRPKNLELWVKKQPPGQRVEDLVAYARWILDRYA